MTNQESCPTNVIRDIPSNIDFCSGKNEKGPHESLAKTLAEFILREEGGSIVGLQGSWGSGKSTVINLLETELSNHAHVFLFDAWSHEGDPLRRIFIERLKIFAQTILGKDNKWSPNLGAFPANHIRTTTLSSRKLEKYGVIFTILTALVPIALVFLKNGLDIGVAFSGNTANVPFIIGILFSILPFVYFLVILLLVKLKIINTTSFPSLFLKEPTDPEVITDTYSSGDPTSVEFEEYFLEIVTKLVKFDNKKIVIIIDNIDRVTPEQGLSILNTLQAFIQTKDSLRNGDKKNPLFEMLWTILPFDYYGLCKIWSQNTPSFQKDVSSDGNKMEKTISGEMIEKKIPIKFIVPPMILSNWKDFFTQTFDRALPQHTAENNQIFNIFLRSLKENYATPTPRDIINYINLLGNLHRQFITHEVLLPSIAYYSIFVKNGESFSSIKSQLLEDKIPSQDLIDLLPESIKEDLAMLIFGLKDRSLAAQLVYSKNVSDSLREGKVPQLASYYQDLSVSFWAIINNILAVDIKNFKFDEIIKAVNSFDQVQRDKFIENSRELANFFKGIGKELLGFPEWKVISAEECNALLILLPYLQTNRNRNAIKIKLNTISISLLESEKESLQDVYTERIKGLIEGLIKIFSVYENQFSTEIQGNDKQKTLFVILQTSISPESTDKFKIEIADDAFQNELISLITEKTIHSTEIKAIIQYFENRVDKLPAFLERIGQVTPGQDLSIASVCLRVLFAFRTKPEAIPIVKTLIKNGQMHSYLFRSITDDNQELSGLLITMIFLTEGETIISSPSTTSTNGLQIQENILTNPEKFKGVFDEIVKITNSENCEGEWLQSSLSKKTLDLVINYLIKEYESVFPDKAFITIDYYFNNWDLLHELLIPNTHKTLIDIYIVDPRFSSFDFWNNPNEKYIEIYLYLLSVNFPQREEIEKNLINWIISLEVTKIELLIQDQNFLDLVIILKSKKPNELVFGIDYCDILKNHFYQPGFSPVPPIIADNWQFLKSLINPSLRKSLENKFLDYLIQNPSEFDSHYVYIDWNSFSKKDLAQYPLFLRKIFCEQILVNPSPEKLNILLSVFSRNPKLLDMSVLNSADKTEFLERFTALEKSDDGNFRDFILSFQKFIKKM